MAVSYTHLDVYKRQQPASAATTEAPDPGAGLTLLEAMEKQLGLKLQPEKRPISVLVIDHVEQKPTDN